MEGDEWQITIMECERNNNDEEHHQAFGLGCGISEKSRYDIYKIRNNDPDVKGFDMYSENFSDLAWELFGRYIAENDHLEDLDVDYCGLTDEKTTHLFKHLTRSTSLKRLFLPDNNFGLGGVQSMIPFLKNAPNINTFRTNNNHNINAECFGLLINSLSGGSITQLNFEDCSIDDITALENYSLPHLKILNLECNNIRIIPSLDKYTNLEELWLYGNNIGRQGCRSIANLLQNNSSRLRCLYLHSNDIGNKEAEILADSLEHNTTLTHLFLVGNKFKEDGFRAFLKLLNDVSSIEQTYKSNHTLRELKLPEFTDSKSIQMKNQIQHFLGIDWSTDDAGDIGQTKVIRTQLNSNTRMELCNLQGIDYSYNSIFAGIDDVLLPNIMALTGKHHGQDELYRMLIATAPDLVSIINRRAALPERIAENVARATALNSSHAHRVEAMNAKHARRVEAMNAKHARKVAALTKDNLRETTALTAQRLEMEREMGSIMSGGGAHSMADTNLSSVRKPRGKKRGRGK